MFKYKVDKYYNPINLKKIKECGYEFEFTDSEEDKFEINTNSNTSEEYFKDVKHRVYSFFEYNGIICSIFKYKSFGVYFGYLYLAKNTKIYNRENLGEDFLNKILNYDNFTCSKKGKIGFTCLHGIRHSFKEIKEILCKIADSIIKYENFI